MKLSQRATCNNLKERFIMACCENDDIIESAIHEVRSDWKKRMIGGNDYDSMVAELFFPDWINVIEKSGVSSVSSEEVTILSRTYYVDMVCKYYQFEVRYEYNFGDLISMRVVVEQSEFCENDMVSYRRIYDLTELKEI